MTVNYEIKGMLAKLLASEDIIVEHKKVSTASFNVHTRVLTLPMWEASNTVVDLLIAHECGHSIFTDDIDWTETYKIPHQFVNIVEDARIEKLMKRKYAGLAKTFFNGYKELNEKDFFQIAKNNIHSYNLADRANLHFKVGNYVHIPIQEGKEKEIINTIASTETFEDVLIAAEELYKYCKEQEKNQHKIANIVFNGIGVDSQHDIQEIFDSFEQEDDSDNYQEVDDIENSSVGGSSQEQPDHLNSDSEENEPKVRTADSLEEQIRNLVSDTSCDNTYLEIPQLNLDTVITKNSIIHENIDRSFAHQQNQISLSNIYQKSDLDFREFKSSAQREVNYLVKEFECRKAADQYARASTARTGILNTAILHSYKYNEDIFKKVSVIPDGKNHGLVFVLDWSGSMSNVMLDTCKQLFNLVWFCKKVSIPFEVYAFTSELQYEKYDYQTNTPAAICRVPHYEKKDNTLIVDSSFSMMNILTSKVSGKELEHQLLNIWRHAYCFSGGYECSYNPAMGMSLSGTPLNEALMTLHQILPKFQKDNNLQKIQCIVLTDGEANQIFYSREVRRTYLKEPIIGTGYIYPKKTFLRDRKLGTTYGIDFGYHALTDTLLRNLKDKFSSVNFIGIRVLENRNANSFIKLYYTEVDEQYKKIENDWKKLKSFTITNSGYDAYFGLSANTLSQDTEFEVDKYASKSQIKTAFVKSLKTKKLNKKVLGEFISFVA